MSEIKIRDLYTGKPDAKDEINFEGLEEFIKTFVVADHFQLDSLLYGNNCFITGFKGTGKTALLFYLDNKLKDEDDMYPLYWTPSRGGIIMRYTYEYKRKCVELYREGKWPETPEGVSDKSFRDKVRLWVRAEDSRGPEALKHKNFNRNWTPEERLELVSQVMSGKSCVSVAIEAGIQDRLLYQWVQNYKTKGYNGLVEMKKGRPSKGVPQMKKEEARPLNESEREELIRLRAENEYIKAENEVIKKEIALREERHAAQLKARKQRSSKSCVKKDTN
ncbi:MAG: transposase [Flavonifractor plautii]